MPDCNGVISALLAQESGDRALPKKKARKMQPIRSAGSWLAQSPRASNLNAHGNGVLLLQSGLERANLRNLIDEVIVLHQTAE